MNDFAEARADVIAAFIEYGEPITVSRPASGYDPATRKRAAGVAQTMTVQGRVDNIASANGRAASAETRTFERTLVLSPDGMTFEPQVGDVVTAEGRQWKIEDGLNITRGGGLVIAVTARMVAA